MAEKTVLLESFLSCHVCSETFRDPVSLGCNHSFCLSCLQKFWEQSKNKNCPICKRKSSKDFPWVNFTMKELADSFAERQKAGSSETEKGEKKVEVVCSKHPEEPRLFCKDEERAVCLVCEFSLHRSHKVVPVEQAVSELKDLLKSDLESLQDKRDKYKGVEETYKKVFQLLSGALTDVAKHLGNLSFRVWEKMKDQVHFSPVILDPNTAHSGLSLSDDLTSVRRGDKSQQLPGNPERFTKYTDVLGSEGFSSGRHSWEVEVGDHPGWLIGLIKESVDRKGELTASPKYGNWCLTHRSGKYTDGAGKTVRVEKNLQRIRVQLDYDRGEVSFYAPEDMTPICTHRDTFTEKLFPYFNIGEAGDAKTADIKICQSEIPL
ncbi:hypothetical protein JOQ06_022027 [Pogonophryne albipinna]|uniref:Zinc-binding protein A33-like n=1 Tax=Pogonophryne albipinna TaxID=1090488 RepID=A0AAD6F502_9TELE|nr:hypothetical protein JOQ06_022027 [Pogonophryne albipinna]